MIDDSYSAALQRLQESSASAGSEAVRADSIARTRVSRLALTESMATRVERTS